MRRGHGHDLRHKIFGDRRDQRRVLRAAGFADEREAAQWALGVVGTPDRRSEVADLRRIRAARPDLTLRTASYILRQTRTRYG